MPAPSTIARALAATFLAGELEVEALIKRGATLLGKRYRWLRTLATRVLATFANHRPRLVEVAQFIDADHSFLRACETYELELISFPLRPTMLPVAAARSWNLPALRTTGELAAWLQLSLRDLEWFADCRGLCAEQSSRLQHYHYRALSKRGGQVRLIEAPKDRLKALQRQLLIEILEPIPLHATVHGFRAGHSIQSFAAPHVGQSVVLKLDLQDFFPTIRAARINSLFRALGYPDSVATLLSGLCTTITPSNVWESIEDISREERWRVATLYSRRHLPQGAPTSPALANLCAYRLDCRLAEFADRGGGRYTRYADDLAFSGDADFAQCIKRFRIQACVIAMEEGFAVHHRKTRIMRPGVRQKLAGLVINEKLNIRRDDYDLLKAILTNCARHGAASQNRAGVADFQAHLLGRISFVAQINPQRGERLQELFNRIVW
jgi:RNA-directed DNA polymerase